MVPWTQRILLLPSPSDWLYFKCFILGLDWEQQIPIQINRDSCGQCVLVCYNFPPLPAAELLEGRDFHLVSQCLPQFLIVSRCSQNIC